MAPQFILHQGFIDMANPALRNGYISVALELVEKLAQVNIPGNEMRVIWVVWRKTWGWSEGDRKRDWEWISYTQFERATGLKHADVGRCLNSLLDKKLLVKKDSKVKFNQNYDDWLVGKRLLVGKSLPSGRQKPTKSGRQKPTNNRYIDINTNTAEASPSDAKLIANIITAFEDVNPSNKKWYGNKTQRGACARLLETHGYDKITKVIALLPRTNHLPYFPCITTPNTLEDKWAQLEAALIRKKGEIKRTVLI